MMFTYHQQTGIFALRTGIGLQRKSIETGQIAEHVFQFVEQLPRIPAFHSTYSLGIDGISLPLILLTTLITIPVVGAAWTVIEQRPAQYYAAFLIMEGLMKVRPGMPVKAVMFGTAPAAAPAAATTAARAG